MLNKALFLSMFLLAIHFLSQPVEIQFKTESGIQLYSSLLHRDEYLCLQFGFVCLFELRTSAKQYLIFLKYCEKQTLRPWPLCYKFLE